MVSKTPPQSADSGDSIGLIAGGGSFPFLVARAAKAKGLRVICAGLRDEVSPELAKEVDVFRVVGVGKLGAVFRYLAKHNVRQVSWAGWLRKETLFSPTRAWRHLPDWRALRFWFLRLRGRDRQTQTMLHAMAEEFEEEGFEIAHSAHHCPEILVEAGLLTRKAPTERQLTDIRFGWNIAKRMADLDVGQSVAVFDRSTVAVEGMEGTDRNIERAGTLCRSGLVIIKLAQDGHDMRYDVPTIGPRTIEKMKEAGAKVLALEAGKTIILEREEVIRLANKYGMVVIAIDGSP